MPVLGVLGKAEGDGRFVIGVDITKIIHVERARPTSTSRVRYKNSKPGMLDMQVWFAKRGSCCVPTRPAPRALGFGRLVETDR